MAVPESDLAAISPAYFLLKLRPAAVAGLLALGLLALLLFSAQGWLGAIDTPATPRAPPPSPATDGPGLESSPNPTRPVVVRPKARGWERGREGEGEAMPRERARVRVGAVTVAVAVAVTVAAVALPVTLLLAL